MADPRLAGLDLTGKVALVSGASSGIGQAVAELLAARGAAVAINYRQSRERAERVVADIVALGGKAAALQADVSEEADVDRLVAETAAQLGPVDILINNAGQLHQRGSFADLSVAAWDHAYRHNLRSAVLLCRAVVPEMVGRGWGRVVNISSVAARHGAPFASVHYAAAKAALNALTLGLAQECASTGVLVNAVAPGATDTPIHAGVRHWFETLSASVPIGRAARPEEVAEVVAFLASPANSYVLGEVIYATGGR